MRAFFENVGRSLCMDDQCKGEPLVAPNNSRMRRRTLVSAARTTREGPRLWYRGSDANASSASPHPRNTPLTPVSICGAD